MLTYRAGAVCHPSTAGFMADHLLERTLPESTRNLAAYYQQENAAERYRGTVPRLRADLSLAWANVLGIDPRRPPTREDLVHVLAGYRADGAKLPGRNRYAQYSDRANIAYRDSMRHKSAVEHQSGCR